MGRSRSIRMVTVLMVVVTSLALGVVPAQAVTVVDPDDTSGPLDIAGGSGSKITPDGPLVLSVGFFQKVPLKLLKKGGHGAVTVLFDVNADTTADYKGNFRYTDKGKLIFLIKGSGSRFEPLKATQPEPGTLKVTVPGGSPPNPATGVAFAFRSAYLNSSSCSTICTDQLPDASGWLGPI